MIVNGQALDHISQAIGSVQASVDAVKGSVDNVAGRVDVLVKSDGAQDAKIDSAHARTDELVEAIQKLTVIVESHEALKNKAIGVGVILGAIAGFLGAVVWKLIVPILKLVGYAHGS